MISPTSRSSFFFFFNDTATTEIYTLSLHDALPIFAHDHLGDSESCLRVLRGVVDEDRKSTRLNSSHLVISYAVFCLKKQTKQSWARFLRQSKETKLLCASIHIHE